MTTVSGSFLRALAVGLAAILLSGCAQPPPESSTNPAATAPADEPRRPRGTLRIAWGTEPETLSPKLGVGAGLANYQWMFDSYLTYFDAEGRSHPMLAKANPTQVGGDWVVNADGTMVTTYRLRENARWHDGTPITARDYVLAFEIHMDPEMPVRDRVPETFVAKIEARDDHTLVIAWRQPYIGAGTLTYQQITPLPAHLVEEKYRRNKASFAFGAEWTSSYVGTGPFRIERWNPGSSLVARAFVDWVLGPPRVETVEVRFISDSSTQVANILAGEIDLISSPWASAQDADVIRKQWALRNEGYIKTGLRSIHFLAFQFREVPNWQSAVADLRVRKALMHATDRSALTDVMTAGLGGIADAFTVPTGLLFPEIDAAVTKYPYDLNRSTALLAETGWNRSTRTALLTNSTGQTLDIELWDTPGGDETSAILADNWKAAGINTSSYTIPAARQRDLELRVSFPAVNESSRSATLDNFAYSSKHLPTAENRWQGGNRGSFRDAEVDRLYDLAMTTIPERERQRAIVGLHRRMSETLGIGPLYYNAQVLIARNRLKGPFGETAEKSGVTWNIFEWEVID